MRAFLGNGIRWAGIVLVGLLAGAGTGNVWAQVRDGGIDPRNLGNGDWIYILPNAVNQMGGYVPGVTNLSSMMAFLKNQGLRYIVFKAGTGAALYPSSASPQFTAELVNAGHAAGLWVMGYNYSTGADIPGEVALTDYVFQQGADGFVFDAEIEWESQNLANNTTLATQLASTVRSNWPGKFIALSTWGYRGYHSSFPYKEFARYCDAIMPQDYWIEFGDTATESVSTMNSQWRTWQNSLTGVWTNAIKPFAPTGQGWSSTSGTINAAQITEFFSALKTVANPVTVGGYKGANFWRAELHPLEVWDAIRTNSLASPVTTAPVLTNIRAENMSATSAAIIWTTDLSSDSAVEYGPTTAYGSTVSNSAALWYHTVNLTGLSPNLTYHYRVKSRRASNPQGVSADYVFTTLPAAVADIYVDDSAATLAGAWTTATSSSAYNGGYRWASSAASETRSATFRPSIVTAGQYDVYVTCIRGANRAVNAPFTIAYNGGSVTVPVSQNGTSGTSSGWVQIASGLEFAAGTSGHVKLSNNTGASGSVVIADGVKFVYVPPPPSGPSIATQPQSRTNNQGTAATFSVVASGTPLLSYQWRHNGTNLAGATASSYTRNNVQPADAGGYSVVITNIVTALTSSTATLAVITIPAIVESPQSVTTNAGADVCFTVAATGTAPLSYQWQWNEAPIAGATQSSYVRTNVQPADAGNYSVIVTNAAGSVTSTGAALVVNLPEPAHLEASLQPDGHVRVTVSAGPGLYRLEAATAPTNAVWDELTNRTTAGENFEYTDPQTNLMQRFYRTRRLQP